MNKKQIFPICSRGPLNIINIFQSHGTQCSSLKCAHAFQCELICIEYEDNMMSHYIEELLAIKWCTKIN